MRYAVAMMICSPVAVIVGIALDAARVPVAASLLAAVAIGAASGFAAVKLVRSA